MPLIPPARPGRGFSWGGSVPATSPRTPRERSQASEVRPARSLFPPGVPVVAPAVGKDWRGLAWACYFFFSLGMRAFFRSGAPRCMVSPLMFLRRCSPLMFSDVVCRLLLSCFRRAYRIAQPFQPTRRKAVVCMGQYWYWLCLEKKEKLGTHELSYGLNWLEQFSASGMYSGIMIELRVTSRADHFCCPTYGYVQPGSFLTPLDASGASRKAPTRRHLTCK